jgi:hypothetical protein
MRQIAQAKIHPVPPVPSYKSYLNWIKNQDQAKSKTFWAEALKDLEIPTLVGNRKQTKKSLANYFRSVISKLIGRGKPKITSVAQKNQITLNTLIQGIWAILLSGYVQHEDITFGTIVSGRSIDLPNAERMAGMYMNILPFRIKLGNAEKFSIG